MKTKATILLVLCALLAFVPACGTISGNPKRPSWQASVYLSFADTWAVTSAAYDGYCELVVRGKVSKQDEQEIDAAWNKFREVFRISFVAASRDWKQFTPEDVRALSQQLIELIRIL